MRPRTLITLLLILIAAFLTYVFSTADWRKNFDQVSVMHACKQNDTNFFVRHASEINLPLKGPSPGAFTFAVIVAAEEGVTNVIEELLQLGADPKAKNWRKTNALIALAGEAQGDPRVTMSRLIDAGLDINAQDATGASALHYAARTGDAVVVDFLLKSGARHDVRDFYGNTPLHLVGTVENAKLLLSAGASLLAKNDAGNTPVELALNRRPEIYKFYSAFSK
jgi:ankyrin repeat protein